MARRPRGKWSALSVRTCRRPTPVGPDAATARRTEPTPSDTRAIHAMLARERRQPMQAVTEGDRRKELAVLLKAMRTHPERDWSAQRARVATLTKLIAAKPH